MRHESGKAAKEYHIHSPFHFRMRDDDIRSSSNYVQMLYVPLWYAAELLWVDKWQLQVCMNLSKSEQLHWRPRTMVQMRGWMRYRCDPVSNYVIKVDFEDC